MKKKSEAEATLLQAVRNMLNSTRKTHLDIYRETGLKPWWIQQVANGKCRNPSVNKIQSLYENLTGKPLQL